MDIQTLFLTLQALRLPIQTDEHELHRTVQEFLTSRGITYEHECTIAPHCRIDFLIGTIGLEIKRGYPQKASVMNQLSRYAACTQISGLILMSEHTLRLPAFLNGKPLYQLSLARLWGIAL